MSRSPAARRYAKALFALANEQQRLDAVEHDLIQIAALEVGGKEVDALTSIHTLTEEGRARAWKAVLDGKSDPLTLRFMLFLSRKGRINQLYDVIREFHALFNEARGIIAVRIESAKALTEGQVAEIRSKFESRFNKKIVATLDVNPTLLGGFIVRIADVVYDYSINHQLNLLHRKLVSA